MAPASPPSSTGQNTAVRLLASDVFNACESSRSCRSSTYRPVQHCENALAHGGDLAEARDVAVLEDDAPTRDHDETGRPLCPEPDAQRVEASLIESASRGWTGSQSVPGNTAASLAAREGAATSVRATSNAARAIGEQLSPAPEPCPPAVTSPAVDGDGRSEWLRSR